MPVLRKFGNDPAAQGGRTVLIVLDHSASMEHRGDGRPSGDRAAHEAAKLIDSLDAEDVVNVLLLSANPTTCFVDFSKYFEMARHFLDLHSFPTRRSSDLLASAAVLAR